MKRTHQDVLVKQVIALHALDERFSNVLRIYKDDEDNFDGQTWMAIELVRHGAVAGRLITKPVASIYAHQNRAEEILASPAEMATFLETGMKAMPAAQRLPLPPALAEHSIADAIGRDRRRASQLADRAARAASTGALSSTQKKTNKVGDVPF